MDCDGLNCLPTTNLLSAMAKRFISGVLLWPWLSLPAVRDFPSIKELIISSPVQVKNSFVNYGDICLALIFEGTSWHIALKEFGKSKGTWGYIRAIHRGKDPTIFIVLMEDSAAIIGLVVAFLGIIASNITGSPAYDAAAAVIIGLILAGTALLLASETKSLLIGESANKEVVQGIREIASSYKEIKQVNEVLTMHMGPDFILVNISNTTPLYNKGHICPSGHI